MYIHYILLPIIVGEIERGQLMNKNAHPVLAVS